MSEIIRYEGERLHAGPQVWRFDADGIRTALPRHVRLHNTFEEGYDWGFQGQRPLELAVNLLVDVLGDDAKCARCGGRRRWRGSPCSTCRASGVHEDVLRLHTSMVWTWIAGLPDARWSLEASDLRSWFDQQVLGLQEVLT